MRCKQEGPHKNFSDSNRKFLKLSKTRLMFNAKNLWRLWSAVNIWEIKSKTINTNSKIKMRSRELLRGGS